MHKGILNKYFVAISSLLTFILMTIWASLTPLWADDLSFKNFSFKEIITSSYSDYLYWNGRFFGQTFFKIFVNIPPIIYGIIIGLCFTLLTLLMLQLSKSKFDNRKNINFKYLFILLAVFLFTPSFSQVYLWRAGTGNYLITTTISLLFLATLLYNKIPGSKIKRYLFFAATCLLGFISGFSNENTPGGILILIIFFILTEKIKVTYFKIIPIVFMAIGYAALLFSPGSKLRALTHPDFMQMNILKKVYTNLPITNNFMINQLFWIMLIFIILCVTNMIIINNKLFVQSLTFFICGLAVIYVLNLSPEGAGEGRAAFGGFILLVIACSTLISLNFNDKYLKSLQIIILVIMSIVTFINLTNGMIDSFKTNSSINQRNNFIKNNLNHTNLNIPPLSHYGESKYSINNCLSDISRDSNFFVNQGYEHAFRFKKVVLK